MSALSKFLLRIRVRRLRHCGDGRGLRSLGGRERAGVIRAGRNLLRGKAERHDAVHRLAEARHAAFESSQAVGRAECDRIGGLRPGCGVSTPSPQHQRSWSGRWHRRACARRRSPSPRSEARTAPRPCLRRSLRDRASPRPSWPKRLSLQHFTVPTRGRFLARGARSDSDSEQEKDTFHQIPNVGRRRGTVIGVPPRGSRSP